jgi:hypothetical protein
MAGMLHDVGKLFVQESPGGTLLFIFLLIMEIKKGFVKNPSQTESFPIV